MTDNQNIIIGGGKLQNISLPNITLPKVGLQRIAFSDKKGEYKEFFVGTLTRSATGKNATFDYKKEDGTTTAIPFKEENSGRFKVGLTKGIVTIPYDNIYAIDNIPFKNDWFNAQLNSNGLFNTFRDKKIIERLNLSGIDTSKCKSLYYGFRGITKLWSLDLSGWDTSNVTNMEALFSGCNKLYSLSIPSFNTANVTSMAYMFKECQALDYVYLSRFDTSKVKSMNNMFHNCTRFRELDLSNFDTSNVTTVFSMFNGCSNLRTLDLSNFNTSNITAMNYTFDGCDDMTSINLAGWDFSKASVNGMFRDCTSLKTVIGPITGIKLDIDLRYSPLTNESAMVFINALDDVGASRTIQFKASTYNTLSPEQIAIATSKGWSVVSV